MGMAVINDNGVILRVNNALCNKLGLPEGAWEGTKLYDLVDTNDVASLLLLLQDVTLGGRSHTRRDLRIVDHQEQVVWFDLALCPYKRTATETQLLAIFVDVSNRKQQERLEQVRNAAGAITLRPGPMAQVATDLGALFVPTLTDGFIMSLEPLGGGPLVRAVHKDRFTESLLLEHHKATRTAPDTISFGQAPMGLAGATLVLPLCHEQERLGSITLVCTDASRRFSQDDIVLAEAIVLHIAQCLVHRRRESTAHMAVKSRDEFLSIAAHELRTPLTPLFLALQQLRRPDASKALGERTLALLLDRAHKQAQHLSELIDDLLDVARITSGPMHLRVEPVNLGSLVHEVLDRLTSTFERAGCVLHVTLSPEACGVWDKSRIEQVVTNLASNALKYGAGQPVWVDVIAVEGKAVLIVQDRGVGVPEDRLENIFERFERAETAEHFDGLGLGLYIARQIVEAHQGEIAVESKVGRGSTFVVRLPLGPTPKDMIASQNGRIVQST